jgi:hypothetical protein
MSMRLLIGGHVSSAERPLASVTSAPLQADPQAARAGWEFYLHALNAVSSPAVAIDRLGFVLGANAAMNPVFDADIRISNRRLLVAHPQSRSRLAALIQRFVGSAAAEVKLLRSKRPGACPRLPSLKSSYRQNHVGFYHSDDR